MKRFSETDKWTKDQWFSELEPRYKLFWLFLIDNCDNVGVWEVNPRMANFLIGYDFKLDEVIEKFSDKLHIFDDGNKWWLRGFIHFQHGTLDPNSGSKPILSYIALLEKHNLYKEYTKGIHTLQGKGKGKGKGNKVATDTGEYTDEFEKFWKVYPKKVAKGGAFKVWQKSKNKPSVDDIIKKVEEYKESNDWKKDGGKYIPKPQNWIVDRCWDDATGVEVFIPWQPNGRTMEGTELCNGLTRKQHQEKYGRLI